MKKTIFDEIQVFLIVRGGLRRKILVENGILNFESVFSSIVGQNGYIPIEILEYIRRVWEIYEN